MLSEDERECFDCGNDYDVAPVKSDVHCLACGWSGTRENRLSDTCPICGDGGYVLAGPPSYKQNALDRVIRTLDRIKVTDLGTAAELALVACILRKIPKDVVEG